MVSAAERAVLDSALEKYRRGRSETILVGGVNLLKPALWLTEQCLQGDLIKRIMARFQLNQPFFSLLPGFG
jgi:hypothetical protein